MKRRIVVTFTDTAMCAFVRGYGSRSLLAELRAGRPPMWSATHEAWCCTERTARDLVAVCESRRIAVEVVGGVR